MVLKGKDCLCFVFFFRNLSRCVAEEFGRDRNPGAHIAPGFIRKSRSEEKSIDYSASFSSTNLVLLRLEIFPCDKGWVLRRIPGGRSVVCV